MEILNFIFDFIAYDIGGYIKILCRSLLSLASKWWRDLLKASPDSSMVIDYNIKPKNCGKCVLLFRVSQPAVALQPGCEEMERE